MRTDKGSFTAVIVAGASKIIQERWGEDFEEMLDDIYKFQDNIRTLIYVVLQNIVGR